MVISTHFRYTYSNRLKNFNRTWYSANLAMKVTVYAHGMNGLYFSLYVLFCASSRTSGESELQENSSLCNCERMLNPPVQVIGKLFFRKSLWHFYAYICTCKFANYITLRRLFTNRETKLNTFLLSF